MSLDFERVYIDMSIRVSVASQGPKTNSLGTK